MHSQHVMSLTISKSITYIADTPCDRALLGRGRSLVGLAVDAQVHDVVAADGAVVDHDVPRPERDGVPLQNVSMVSRNLATSCKCTFLTSNLFLPSASPLGPTLLLFAFGGATAAASVISTSAILRFCLLSGCKSSKGALSRVRSIGVSFRKPNVLCGGLSDTSLTTDRDVQRCSRVEVWETDWWG